MAEDWKKIEEGESMATRKLPEELIVDILSRLPVKSLVRFRCVCKHWCALINDPSFVKLQLNRSLATNSNVKLVVTESYHIYSVELDACEEQAPMELVHPARWSSQNTTPEIVGSCNGILCMADSTENMFLWNPFTRRYQIIPSVPREDLHVRFIDFGFGYDPINDDYKLVILRGTWRLEVLVYTLSNNSWRSLGDMPFLNIISPGGVLANSVLHWVTSILSILVQGSGTLVKGIVSFDLKEEKCQKVPLPDFEDHHIFDMTVGALGGQLCVLCNFYSGNRVELWVMKDYGVKDSWVQQFSVENFVTGSFTRIYPVCYSKNGEVILHKDSGSLPSEGTLFLFDSHRRRGRSLRIHDALCFREAAICVESLVHLDTSDGTTKRKRTTRTRKRAEIKGERLTLEVKGLPSTD